MQTRSRRKFLAGTFALAASASLARAVHAAMGPNDKFDLVIKGGEVLDPSQKLRGIRDIGIRYGVVEAVEPGIPAERALRVLDANGRLVTPGLIDLHAHTYPYGSAIGIPADGPVAYPAPATSSRIPSPARRTTPASSPTSCRTASCCPPRSTRRSAASCSTSATAAAASTTPSPRRRSPRASAPTPSPRTSTSSPATRRACRISPG